MTKAVRFHQFGGPEVLHIGVLPTPIPGSGEVRLKMHVVGLNRGDSILYRGMSENRANLPSRLGREGSGTVEAIAPDIDPSWLGRKVAIVPTSSWGHYGTLGERVVAPLDALVECPFGFSDSECSAIWLHFLTAYAGLIDTAHVRRGDWVLVASATSSLGIAAIQVAKTEGATTIAIAGDSRWTHELEAIGADYVLAADQEDIAHDIQKITRGQGLRVVFSSMNEPLLPKALAVLQSGGILLESEDLSEVGVASTATPTLSPEITVWHCDAAQVSNESEKLAAATTYIRDRLKFGFIQVEIARKFTFPDVVEAYRYLESNEAFGKVVVTFPDKPWLSS